MKSSTRPKRAQSRREPLLVASAGLPYRQLPADPIAAWLDLMETVALLQPAHGRCARVRKEDQEWRL